MFQFDHVMLQLQSMTLILWRNRKSLL